MKSFRICICMLLAAAASVAAEPLELHLDPYDFDTDAPQWAKDLRRAEIITLGAVPFVALGVTLTYSVYRYFAHGMDADYIPNPFASSSDAAHLSTQEQIGIVATTAGICVAIGLTDFLWNYIERKQKEKESVKSSSGVSVSPFADMPGNRVYLPLPDSAEAGPSAFGAAE